MTKKLLEQYPNICGELAELQTRHVFNDRQKELSAQRREIEQFVCSLPWEKRTLVQCVLTHGTKWDVVRREIGSLKSADAVRKDYERIFKKI